MKKKILFSIIAGIVVVGGVAALSAYEAHVINVTAHIENALSVDTYEIDFGTVFPQEYLEREFTISLSDSFLAAARVDDVEYKIVQKPKCKADNPQAEPQYKPVDYATHECPLGYTEMLSLCPFLSKLPQDEEVGDIGEPSYYDADTDSCPTDQVEPMARGILAKSDQDTSDIWTVDLKVPPVDGYVGQDWPEGCPVVNENDRDYGCDLWIEVTGISRTNGICSSKPDVMSILDRSGSIAGSLATLKTAALAFVTALSPSTDGAHMGQTSFADTGTLDLHLTASTTAINAAINGLVSNGYTNLYEGLLLANQELADGVHDRNDTESPDFMVVITDGAPNRPIGTSEQDAIDAATAAKNAGVTIYVVGVGVTTSNADWLKNNIATTPGHYYDASDFSQLQSILESIAFCD